MLRFPLGTIYLTPGAGEALDKAGEYYFDYLKKHGRCDWGDMCKEDKEANEQALIHGDRLMSAYTLSTGEKLWVITEWDRSATTVLTPDEY